ncbi:mitochondrial carrier [Microthyrium microscopicum]|uniref:Mitochondrial carrier n=1 Tax=Microthyrium microscopicum TaxID=703497 RepID=A0A6A6U704_9PEZI|nr:mitochondrial carrier [Microthyrium microscopicum]
MSKDGSRWSVESPWVRSLLAGAVAGTCTDISLYPLDTLKTRLQAKEGFFRSGGFRNIYRGIGAVVAGSAPSAALFFVTYDTTKRVLLDYAASTSSDPSSTRSATGELITAPRNVDPKTAAAIHMVAGSFGEIAGCVIRVPVEVVKQRAQANQHPSSFSSLMHIVRSNNGLAFVREMYRGGGITLLRELPFTMIQFPLWEALKAWHVTRMSTPVSSIEDKNGSVSESLRKADTIGAIPSALYGSAAGAVAAGLTTPLDVLKTRLMLSKERVGALHMFSTILKESGPRALFAGIGPRVMWISIGGAIFLGSYQWASNEMESRRSVH